MNNRIKLFSLSALALATASHGALVISQYAEDGDIKGVEIWNTGSSAINFDSSTNQLTIANFNNGATSATFTFTKSTGSIAAGGVLVFADDTNNIWTDSGITFEDANFSFNGDDALELRLGGTLMDEFGTVGNDPGSAWSGSGVSTVDQNIQLKQGFTTGDVNGWSNPSERFETVASAPLDSTTPGAINLQGFGVAPIPEPSAYAALLGALAIGFVAVRRRRR